MPQREVLDETPGQRVITIGAVLSADECAAWIAKAEARGFEAAAIRSGRSTVEIDVDVRNNARIFLDDDALADTLWLRTASLLPKKIRGWTAVGLHERFRFYRYDPEERFAPHIDGPTVRSRDEKSRMTFMVYLNDGFEGGETVFFEEDGTERLRVEPSTGMALVFDHHQLHEGANVVRGRKYVLRTDVMFWNRNA